MIKKVAKNIAKGQEEGARKSILEDLFYDFHKNRRQVFRDNFVRGIFFGLGSAIGGTIVLALIVWILSLFSHTWLAPLVDTVQNATQK